MSEIRKKILVVDDDKSILEVMKAILEMHGYDVAVTADGQAIYEVKTQLPDLLLLDIWMGQSDGRVICKALKKQPDTRNIPIIMVSATRDLEQSAKISGADDFLEKPFDMEDLVKKVQKFL